MALRVAHQRLGAGPGGEAHLHPARGVRRAEESLRPRRVVAVHEHLLRAVDRQRLGVRDETADRELEVAPLLDRALRHHSRPAGLGADEERERVERRIARDADGRLDLGEAAPRGLGGVGGQERRALLEVRHVRLVRRRAPRAELLQREHQLDRVEKADDARELRRGEPSCEAHQLGAWDVERDQHAGELEVLDRHRLRRRVRIEAVCDHEAVDDVEVGRISAVHSHDGAALDDELRRRVARPVRSDEAELRVRRDEQLAVEVAPLARGETPASHAPAAPARNRRSAASRTKAAVSAAPWLSRSAAQASSSGAVARRGRRAVYTASRSSSGTAASSAARSKLAASGSRPAARATSDWRRSVSGVARISAASRRPSRSASSVTSESARPPGVVTRSGRRVPRG